MSPNPAEATVNSIFPAIIATAKKASDTVAEGADAMLLLATDSDILSQIPIFSSAVKILKIRDILVKKRLENNCKEFTLALTRADPRKIKSLIEKIQLDREYSEDFSDTLLSILVEGQKPLKCRVVGNLLVALSDENISTTDFQTLSQVVQSITAPSLKELESFVTENAAFNKDNPYIKNGPEANNYLLLSTGLAFMTGTILRLTELGQTLYLHGLMTSEA